MRIALVLSILVPAAATAQSVDLQTLLQPAQVCALTRDVATGSDGPDAGAMVEVVRRIDHDGRPAWRAIHFPLRIVEKARAAAVSFDMTDVDAATLRPIEGESRYTPAPTRFDYAGDTARRLGPAGEVLDTTQLGGRVPLPWYPGATILVQAVPWRDALRAYGYIVDNYVGTGDARLRRVEVAVEGRTTVEVAGVVVPAYRVVWRAAGGFESHEQISIARPHQTLEFDFYPKPGAKPVRSRVTAFAAGVDCATIAAATLPSSRAGA